MGCFLSFRADELERIECPKGWMSLEGYNRYLEVTLAKMRQSQDARQTDNRGAAIVFRLETSALLGARRLAREGNRPDFSSVNLKPMG